MPSTSLPLKGARESVLPFSFGALTPTKVVEMAKKLEKPRVIPKVEEPKARAGAAPHSSKPKYAMKRTLISVKPKARAAPLKPNYAMKKKLVSVARKKDPKIGLQTAWERGGGQGDVAAPPIVKKTRKYKSYSKK